MENFKNIMLITCFILILIFSISEIIKINIYRKGKNKDKYKEIRNNAKNRMLPKILYKFAIVIIVIIAIYSVGLIIFSSVSLLDTNFAQYGSYSKLYDLAEKYFKTYDLCICGIYFVIDVLIIREIYINKEMKFDLSILGKEHKKE